MTDPSNVAPAAGPIELARLALAAAAKESVRDTAEMHEALRSMLKAKAIRGRRTHRRTFYKAARRVRAGAEWLMKLETALAHAERDAGGVPNAPRAVKQGATAAVEAPARPSEGAGPREPFPWPGKRQQSPIAP